MAPDVAASTLASLPRLAQLVKAATGAPAVKVLQNSGAEAGQEVFHAHFHVVPRFGKGDSSEPGPMLPAEAAEATLPSEEGRGALASGRCSTL
ncbi:hypothetical protein EMIHUDRAFT_239458 [Emiliania huxleyi CCMP1516]|uniref:HIT domain-containing protein n=2 Tax=Emiliania huxleyi TaxID=2903 RepID=A0A0D3JJ73_EMIH1|nr:hypothetical protein EMIHUDRAFT_239458 [Emiliania huxleyi CCMP1516]EOD23558.1 hypothetical protein EMIHUDRAFT_239458 [Emiliania huxleyi CCMP1516]|eukprot:XP_005775987.1 hypothetical protein EMIHUDRAFT_239458 [Emiliania huxleyi CCMP1516]